MRRIKQGLFAGVCLLGIFAVADCKDKEDGKLIVAPAKVETRQEDDRRSVALSLNNAYRGVPNDGKNAKTKCDATSCWVYVDVRITSIKKGDAKKYLHIFQREGGGEYYYQSSTDFVVTGANPASLQVWPGGKADKNKMYAISAIVNDRADYPKDPNGIFKQRSLPDPVEATLSINRQE